MNNTIFYGRYYHATIAYVTDANQVITHSTFINNIGHALGVTKTNMSVSHSEFISNQNGYGVVNVYMVE